MLFKLSNATASFQGNINKIMAEKLNIFDTVYLNDIFIYTKDPGQPHVNAVQGVLKELGKNSFFANFKKCCFHKDKICLQGYILSV